MPVPLVTFGIVILRASLRPINKILHQQFQNSRNNPIAFQFFTTIGYTSHKVESFINSNEENEEKNQIVKKMTKEAYLSQVQNVFKSIDTDKSGFLDKEEVWNYHQESARILGVLPSEEEFQKSWRRLDKDGDGEVTLKEMLSLAEEDWTKLQK